MGHVGEDYQVCHLCFMWGINFWRWKTSKII